MKTRLRVRVTPRARRDEVVGWQGGVLRVRVSAPPLEGKANAAVAKLLAKTLGVPSRDIAIARGERSREKQVVVDGLSEAEVRALLAG
ncbi:MAG TPA: DUF167 domain-containing protein [Dehalococcoidia bacterium]|nr:DUF167 domain-containing protein [Dehalococcoidia bacterium]